jgi:hypothetical protein
VLHFILNNLFFLRYIQSYFLSSSSFVGHDLFPCELAFPSAWFRGSQGGGGGGGENL